MFYRGKNTPVYTTGTEFWSAEGEVPDRAEELRCAHALWRHARTERCLGSEASARRAVCACINSG
jgi:hypothetical protein